MLTHVVALQDRSVRASSPKFVGPVWGRLVALGLSGWPALYDFATKARAVRKLRREHGLRRESRSRASWSLALRFSASPAPTDLATKPRAITGLRREPSLCLEWVCLVSQLLALRAGVLRRAQCFYEPLTGFSSRSGTVGADIHILELRLCLAAYARLSSSPTPMSFPLYRTPQANPSVNLRANGWPRYRTISFSLPRGQPLTPGYLER